MSKYFPEELVFNILSRLPSKSLLCFRLVCKSWCSLISSNHFKLVHLKTFNLSNPRIFIRHYDAIENKEFYSLHFDDEALTMVPVTLVDFPFRYCNICPKSYLRVLGCVSGVMCLIHDNCVSNEDKLILWNPSIRKHLTLTCSMFHLRDEQCMRLIYGFGYDKASDDFKVVRLGYDLFGYHSFSIPQVKIYSVKNGTTKIVRFSHDLPCYSMWVDSWSQLFLNGCVHWVVCDYTIRRPNVSIMTFDMSTEHLGEIELPNYFVNKDACFTTMSVVKGCLTVIYTSRPKFPYPGPSGYTISVMKEYKNRASWTLMYDVHYPYDLGRVLHLRDNGGIFMGHDYGDLSKYEYKLGNWLDAYSKFVVEGATTIGEYKESLSLLYEGHADRYEEHNE